MTSLFVPLLGAMPTTPPPNSWWDTIVQGGMVGFIILALSIVALVLVIIHFAQIRKAALLPPGQLLELEQRLKSGNIDGAAAYCIDPVNDSFLTRILGAGLFRYQRSAFGVFEIKSAVEEAGEEQAARLYRATDGPGSHRHDRTITGGCSVRSSEWLERSIRSPTVPVHRTMRILRRVSPWHW